MSQEFSPQASVNKVEVVAPQVYAEGVVARDMKTFELKGDFLAKHVITERVTEEALRIADDIDDKKKTLIGYRGDAVKLGFLTSKATLRGAQIRSEQA